VHERIERGAVRVRRLEDAGSGRVLEPTDPDRAAVDALVRERQPSLVTYQDWMRLDEIECARGEECGRPRIKFTSRAEVRSALTGS